MSDSEEERKRRRVMDRWEWSLLQCKDHPLGAGEIMKALYAEDKHKEKRVQHAEMLDALTKVEGKLEGVENALGKPDHPLSIIAENLDHLETVAEHIRSLPHIEEALGQISGEMSAYGPSRVGEE